MDTIRGHTKVGGLVTALTSHGHGWSPTQRDLVARAMGLLQRWEDGMEPDEPSPGRDVMTPPSRETSTAISSDIVY